MNILVFELEGRRFALPADRVREIARMVAITPLPEAPAAVEGVVDVRGTIVPVFDLRRRLALPAAPVRPHEHLVLAESAGRAVALRVDQADTLLEVPNDAIAPAPPRPGTAAGTGSSPHAAGMATLPDGVVVIYDLDAFLSADEARTLDVALESRRG